ncbi:DUF3696 domain-containing protein [Methylomonas albis]|uniref:DUF3696 domain-containing protein n=1 Tax=Methylomonas albis TaxID=1854563 RepID=A0ABR9D761_9GAMM|nr:DUF3696 domain-containing protein [Methylomonas albis]
MLPEHIALHFFNPRSADAPQIISPQINTHGDLSCWPDGFLTNLTKI